MDEDAEAELTCSICINKYNNSKHTGINCAKCHEDTCHECVTQYLLTLNDPRGGKCMRCNHPWSSEFLARVLKKGFRTTTLKKYQETIMLQQEKSWFVLSQPFLEHEFKVRKAKKEEAEATNEYRRISREPTDENLSRRERHLQQHRKPRTQQAAEAKALAQEATRRRIALTGLLRTGEHGEPVLLDAADPTAAGPQAQRAHREFIQPCPHEGCLGKMSEDYVCGLCETVMCPKCHAVTSDGGAAAAEAPHACNPQDVESVRAIRRDSRQCPKCGVPIHRIEGCDQMFCTAPNCATAFSYATGKIYTQHIHNPHYIEYVRRGGAPIVATAADVEAGAAADCINFNTVQVQLNALLRGVPSDVATFLLTVTTFAIHLDQVTLPDTAPPDVPPQWRNHKLRMRLMDPSDKLNEDGFKTQVFKGDKADRCKA